MEENRQEQTQTADDQLDQGTATLTGGDEQRLAWCPVDTQASSGWVKKNKGLLIAVAALMLILASSGIALGVYTWDNGLIADGISISKVPVGNLTREEAKRKLDYMVKGLLDQTLKFDVNGQTVELKLGQLGLSLPFDQALAQAYKVGREGNIAQKVVSKRKATQGISFELTPQWDDKKVAKVLTANLKGFNIPAVDASFTITPDNRMNIKPEKTGVLVDIAHLVNEVKKIDIFHPGEVKVSFKADLPKLTAAQLDAQKITGLIASFTTSFDQSRANRAENIRVAAAALDGAVVKPGDTFSFNSVVGPRSTEAGYKTAPVILNGQLVPGIGGGVCQVSTTLYNSVLLANLAVVERTNHSETVGYVPLGRDATVVYPSLDFKFKNNSGGYVLIRSKVSDGTVTIDLYGQVKPEQQVSISSSNKYQVGSGFAVTTYRTVTVKGQVVKRETLGTSVYH